MRSMKQTLAGAALVAASVASTGANAATFDYTGAVVSYTVPTSGLYDVTAAGGQGGDGGQIPVMGGAGATISGDIFLTAGARLDVVVGGQGLPGDGGGGGGGSFIFVPASSLPLLVAGGGGGGGYTEPFLTLLYGQTAPGGPGQTGPAGQAGIGGGGAGGVGGSGGASVRDFAPGGGGGGWAGNGGYEPPFSGGPGYGGFGAPTFAGGLGLSGGGGGGFGGGGAGGFSGGGGGGGYSGGGGGDGGADNGLGGGGGGSFVDPRFFNVVAIPGDNDGNGFVTIDAVPEPLAPAVLGAGLVALGLVRRRRPRP